MRRWSPERVAEAAGARLLAPGSAEHGPERAVIDSREAGPGTLFVGLPGTKLDGGRFASEAIDAGAWGVLVADEHGERVAQGERSAAEHPTGAILATSDPLKALQQLATAWRRHLQAQVIGVTGSTGKTSTKDLLLALIAPHRRTVASRANYNTEIGLPLEILSAAAETEVLVLEMAMRGVGQIAELAQIAEPDVGVIVSVGPVHLELLGSVEAVAAAKAELIAALQPGATAVLPAGETLLEPHLRADIRTITFGEGGDVHFLAQDRSRVEIALGSQTTELEVSFEQAHLRRDLLAAAAAADAIGLRPSGRVQLALGAGRGLQTTLAGGVTLIDDCYNANPMSMRAALEDLARRGGDARRVAVLGDMLELGPREREFHEQLGAAVTTAGVEVLITVGPLAAAIGERFTGETLQADDAAQAAALLERELRPGDVVLVKGSHAVGLELVCRSLQAGAPV
jgi:UDP-N-acetylmuramoyl-tripeptide--D-alanyl-D-alanine ligase